MTDGGGSDGGGRGGGGEGMLRRREVAEQTYMVWVLRRGECEGARVSSGGGRGREGAV